DPKLRDEIERTARKTEDLEEFEDDLLEEDAITWPYGTVDENDKRSLKSFRSRFEDEDNEYENIIDNNSGNNDIERNAIHNKLFGLEISVLATALCPSTKGSPKFQLSIDDLTFVGQPVFMNRADENKQIEHSTFFHLVFVLDPPELELCKQVDSIYKHVITKLTAALQYEQQRCGYVRAESELIMSLRDNT
ncbi:3392_t:CDS:2, partial [Scutellospora calospora]